MLNVHCTQFVHSFSLKALVRVGVETYYLITADECMPGVCFFLRQVPTLSFIIVIDVASVDE